jgi:hypothetical protein
MSISIDEMIADAQRELRLRRNFVADHSRRAKRFVAIQEAILQALWEIKTGGLVHVSTSDERLSPLRDGALDQGHGARQED